MKAKRRLTRIESRQLTRARLVAAAGSVFTRAGFDAASVEEIAGKAGFSRGAFYSNFSSKDEIFLELLEEKHRQRANALEAIFHETQDPVERFHRGRAWYAEQGEQREWGILEREFRLRALRVPAVKKRLAEITRQELDTYTALASQYLTQAGISSPDRPRVVALALIALAQGLSNFSLVDPGPETVRAIAEARDLVFERFVPRSSARKKDVKRA